MSKRKYAPKTESSIKRSRSYYPKPQKSLFGNQTSVTLKYVEYFNLDPSTAGIPATFVCTANGLFDPNITGVGRQPRGFDQIKVLFDHYKVNSSTIKCTFMAGAAQSAPFICGVQLADDATPEADMIHAMENRNVNYGPLAQRNDTLVRKLSFDSSKYFSVNDRDLYGTSTTNPADQAYYIIFAQPVTSVDSGSCSVMVEIFYNVTFSEPNNVSGS